MYPQGNYGTAGPDAVPSYLADALAAFNIRAPQSLGLLLAVAGAGSPGAVKDLTRRCERLHFQSAFIKVASDVEILKEALQSPTGAVIISGTGSVVRTKAIRHGSEGEFEVSSQKGGHGSSYGDAGSGSAIGREAISEAVFQWDVEGPVSTKLIPALRRYASQILCDEKLDLPATIREPKDLQKIFHLVPRDLQNQRFAGFAPFVLEVANQGDEIALGIVANAARKLAQQTVAALNDLQSKLKARGCDLGSQKIVVGLHGGMFKSEFSEEMIINPLRKMVEKHGFSIRLMPLGISAGDNSYLFAAIRSLFRQQLSVHPG